MTNFNDEKSLRILALLLALAWLAWFIELEKLLASGFSGYFLIAIYIGSATVGGGLSYRLGYNRNRAIGGAFAAFLIPLIVLPIFAFTMDNKIDNLIKNIKNFEFYLQQSPIETFKDTNTLGGLIMEGRRKRKHNLDILEYSVKKSEAERELISTNNRNAIVYLIRALNDEDSRIRIMLVPALENNKEPRVIEALIRTAKEDKDAKVRERAMEALNEAQGSIAMMQTNAE